MDEPKEKNEQGLFRASSRDFESIDLGGLLATLSKADCYAVETALQVRQREAADRGDGAEERALRILSLICTFHLQVEDPATPFVPRWSAPDCRSYQPSDFRGEQNDALADIIASIGHPTLRARVADVVWFNDRRKWKAAYQAVKAYCELVAKRIAGELHPAFDGLDETIGDAVDFFHRSLQIALASGKRGTLPDVVRDTFFALYAYAKDHTHYVHFVAIARLGTSYDLITWDVVAKDAESLATGAGNEVPPWAIQPVWRLAADAYERLDEDEAKHYCIGRSIEQTLRNREFVNHPAARAHWTRRAIAELRQAGGFRERIRELRAELRDFQEQAVDETALFSIPFDLSIEQQGAVKIFSELTLPDVLLRFGLLTHSPKLGELREQAEKSLKASPLGAMFGGSYVDHEGKVLAETGARGFGEGASDAHVKEACVRILDMRWHYVVNGFLEPARRTVMTRFPLEERHFRPIVEASAFVPPGHEHIFCLGFARFWQGDYASAIHLLVPQIENSMRHVLLNSNEDTSKMSPELVQDDRTLSGLLQNSRPEVERVFGEDIANEMDLLFVHKPGPALRHDLAHGKLHDGACYQADAIFACWFVYHLTVVPLADHWEAVIAPAIERTAF
ncbi:DUF4209 domain-containing protein [Burkholderia gladioli]